jgi:hypothetical protein
MPEISRFLGIVIRMYVNDHVPPHFHAKYGQFEIKVEIETGDMRWGPSSIGMSSTFPS